MSSLQKSLLVLAFIIIGRFLTLEFIDLLDPSETRYAFIAAYMLKSQDWITPQLATPEGIVPFLSKPPLHYWLVALSYNLFGIDEWSSRLPSYLAFLVLIGCCYVVTTRLRGKYYGILASLLCGISPLLYFVAGGTTVDATLSAFVALALTAYFFYQEDLRKHKHPYYGYLFFASRH
jgi:4-amino-4-deoxy-L-arabinose transferase-like glycosyltransferase